MNGINPNDYHSFREDDPMDIESSSSDSGEDNLEGSPTPEPTGPIEEVTTILTCGNCSHDIILSGKLLSEGVLLVPHSPIPHILGTNTAPNFHEESSILGYLHSTSKALTQLDWEIARLGAIMQTLVVEREKLVNTVEEHKAMFSPIRRVPPDILSEIFIRCQRGAPCDVIPHVPDNFDKDCGPLLLTSICRRWRDHALKMPNLWSSIRIRIGKGEFQESRRLPLINAWLERSSNRPLTVCMVEPIPRSPSYSFDSQNIAVGMLIATARRWKNFYLILQSTSSHWGLFRGLSRYLTNLNHCSIIGLPGLHKGPEVEPPAEAINLLSDVHALRSLTLDSSAHTLGLDFSRQTITHLDLYTVTKERSIPINMAYETLNQCPRLLSFRIRCHFTTPITPTLHLHHRKLQSLEILMDTDSGPGHETLTSHLTTPSLSSLAITSPELEWNQNAFMSFLERSGTLESLTIRCKTLERREALQILSYTSQLTSLTLDMGLGITDSFLNTLSIPQPSPDQTTSPQILVPFLKYLELGGRIFIKDTDFISFILSRRYPEYSQVTPLNEVVISCDGLVYGFLSAELMEQLDDLCWWGFRARIVEGGRVGYSG